AEVVRVLLSPNAGARNKELDFYFENLDIKGRSSMGNQVTKYSVKSIKLKEKGKSTLERRKYWYDDKLGRLNTEEKGLYLGTFENENLIVVFRDGSYEITDTELTQRFDPEKVMLVEQFNPEKVITAVYLDKEKNIFNVKRFRIETSTMHSKFSFIKEGDGNALFAVTSIEDPVLIVQGGSGKQVRTVRFKIGKMVDVMGWKAIGAKLMEFTKSAEMEWEQPSEENEQPSLFDA
ncbi:MAG: DNA gyrase/topoisomerase IV subunit A, partial [Pseudopedobacter saltans]